MQHLVTYSDLEHVLKKGFQPKGHIPGASRYATKFFLGDGQYVSIFHIKPIYYRTKYNTWRPLTEITSHHGNRHIVLKPEALTLMHPEELNWYMKRQSKIGSLVFDGIGIQPRHLAFATTSTFYPDPDTETATLDGAVMYSSNANWNTVHDAIAGTSASDSAVVEDSQTEKRFNSEWFVKRFYAYFNTGSISSSDTISAATLSVTNHPNSQQNMAVTTNCFHAVVQVQGDSVVSDTALNTADFDLCGDAIDNPTEAHDSGERFNVSAGFPASGTVIDFNFNSTGIGWIAQGTQEKPTGGTAGITYLGIRSGEDITDTPGAQGTADRNRFSIYTAENTGTSLDPVLTVVHAAGGGNTTNFFAYF